MEYHLGHRIVIAPSLIPATESIFQGADVPNVRAYCPACKAKGRVVTTQTVKAMLAVSLATLQSVQYEFCRTPDCPVIYFATDGQQTFSEVDLREQVYQKHISNDDVWVCYCFRHTLGTIRTELATTGTTTVVEHIKAGISADQCACDIRNPQGDCCLGNVIALLKHLRAKASIS